jgi:DNA-binding XRE family transcriptional regulator
VKTEISHGLRQALLLRLKACRERLGLSQQRVAQALGVSWGTVNRWEVGSGDPSPMAVSQIERWLAEHEVRPASEAAPEPGGGI